ncbi:hypothetical protein BDS110ZK18_36630 [Bradyrhizobium diazoefficiens]|uniref:AAA+ ATPase domain-containing protein n=1 Tax=Bradyrhizobium diazoefficiens TaxID=1355477 RepID=A0A809XJ98_9BRAD|nr:hypothetical protein XF2B_07420 [Bradyrhizobium diazoefficiens]BCF14051.1 hypothetical protein XF13B_07420 [Bradyrhizobium diazoefficiens]
MAVYVSADRIREAITHLGSSRAKRTSLFDFLIVKRTLAIKRSDAVAIAESEPAFIEALNEVGLSGTDDRDRLYFNPFAVNEEGKTGYRPARYRSNGTNSTISGVPWQTVIELTSTKPRQASLKPGYLQHLSKLILAANDKPLPRLADFAVWYWRQQDVEPLIAGADSTNVRMQRLVDEVVARFQLSSDELEILFDEGIGEDDSTPVFVSEPPPVDQYLPQKTESAVPSHEALSEVSFDLIAALAAKNFVILTGPSGTGKSRAALKLAEALQRLQSDSLKGPLFAFIPVGPDWTTPKRLLGFRTPFGKERKLSGGEVSHESYEITDCVRLLLRASHPDAADVPHFLIFDEMNLSHVERYFAPFLSLMEASAIVDSEGELALIGSDDLKLISAVLDDVDPSTPEADAARTLLAQGKSLLFPANLFCIGTVNVDDTTYMFSPKVLDRSHVIELGSERPSSYLVPDRQRELGGDIAVSIADQVLRTAIGERESKSNAVTNASTMLDRLTAQGFSDEEISLIREQTIKTLDGCYDLLSPVGFAFGYRASKEVFAYVTAWLAISTASGADKSALMQRWYSGLDKAVSQKLLPKLHGNRRSLGESLSALAAFLAGADENSVPPAAYTLGSNSKIGITAEGRFPVADKFEESRRKLLSMNDRLNAVGYVSFVS